MSRLTRPERQLVRALASGPRPGDWSAAQRLIQRGHATLVSMTVVEKEGGGAYRQEWYELTRRGRHVLSTLERDSWRNERDPQLTH